MNTRRLLVVEESDAPGLDALPRRRVGGRARVVERGVEDEARPVGFLVVHFEQEALVLRHLRVVVPPVRLAELERVVLARGVREDELVEEAIVGIDRVLVADREQFRHDRPVVADRAPHVDEREPPARELLDLVAREHAPAHARINALLAELSQPPRRAVGRVVAVHAGHGRRAAAGFGVEVRVPGVAHGVVEHVDAAPVPRVHCDYTADGAPRRLRQLGEQGIYSRVRGRVLTSDEVEELTSRRFAFINVWRSISDDGPVVAKLLAVCDENSVDPDDRFLYELIFPDPTGENYSLKFSEAHRWYYYPKMTKDECLLFKVYDKKADGPRFVFHTSFDDPRTPPDAPPRKSIEARCIAFFDD